MMSGPVYFEMARTRVATLNISNQLLTSEHVVDVERTALCSHQE